MNLVSFIFSILCKVKTLLTKYQMNWSKKVINAQLLGCVTESWHSCQAHNTSLLSLIVTRIIVSIALCNHTSCTTYDTGRAVKVTRKFHDVSVKFLFLWCLQDISVEIPRRNNEYLSVPSSLLESPATIRLDKF